MDLMETGELSLTRLTSFRIEILGTTKSTCIRAQQCLCILAYILRIKGPTAQTASLLTTGSFVCCILWDRLMAPPPVDNDLRPGQASHCLHFITVYIRQSLERNIISAPPKLRKLTQSSYFRLTDNFLRISVRLCRPEETNFGFLLYLMTTFV